MTKMCAKNELSHSVPFQVTLTFDL